MLRSTRLIASGRVIEFKSSIRFESSRISFKSWNRKVDPISNIRIVKLNQFLILKLKIKLYK